MHYTILNLALFSNLKLKETPIIHVKWLIRNFLRKENTFETLRVAYFHSSVERVQRKVEIRLRKGQRCVPKGAYTVDHFSWLTHLPILSSKNQIPFLLPLFLYLGKRKSNLHPVCKFQCLANMIFAVWVCFFFRLWIRLLRKRTVGLDFRPKRMNWKIHAYRYAHIFLSRGI